MEADDEGNQVCFLDANPAGIPSQFYLNEACGYAQSLVPNLESPGQENGFGSGFFNWIGDNFSEIVNAGQTLFGDNPPAPAPSGNNTYIPPSNGSSDQGSGMLWYILGGAVLLLVVILLIRKIK